MKAIADEEHDALVKVVLKKFLALAAQTTAKNWFQIRMEKPKRKLSILVSFFMDIIQVSAHMRQEVA